MKTPFNRAFYAVILTFLLLVPSGCQKRRYSMGDGTINGRSYHYYCVDSTIQYVLFYQKPDRPATRGSMKSGKHFELQEDGISLFLYYINDKRVDIDRERYDLSNGAVFIVRISPEGNEVRQLPIQFEPKELPAVPTPDHVESELRKAAAENDELKRFLDL